MAKTQTPPLQKADTATEQEKPIERSTSGYVQDLPKPAPEPIEIGEEHAMTAPENFMNALFQVVEGVTRGEFDMAVGRAKMREAYSQISDKEKKEWAPTFRKYSEKLRQVLEGVTQEVTSITHLDVP